jgi:hypothetical protein
MTTVVFLPNGNESTAGTIEFEIGRSAIFPPSDHESGVGGGQVFLLHRQVTALFSPSLLYYPTQGQVFPPPVN